MNPEVVSPSKARGLLQLTDIGVEEVTRVYKISPPEDIFDPEQNIKFGMLLLAYYSEEARNESELLALYNGGYRQLNNLRARRKLAPETEHYIRTVRALKAGAARDWGAHPYSEIVDRQFSELCRLDYENGKLFYKNRVPTRLPSTNCNNICDSIYLC